MNEQQNRDALISHIQALDTIIRNRNETIKAQAATILQLQEIPVDVSEAVKKKVDKAYAKGWTDCVKLATSLSKDHRTDLLFSLAVGLKLND